MEKKEPTKSAIKKFVKTLGKSTDDDSDASADDGKRKRGCSVLDDIPAVPKKHGTVHYAQGKIYVCLEEELYKVLPEPGNKNFRRVLWSKFGGKKKAWEHALGLIDAFAAESKPATKAMKAKPGKKSS